MLSLAPLLALVVVFLAAAGASPPKASAFNGTEPRLTYPVEAIKDVMLEGSGSNTGLGATVEWRAEIAALEAAGEVGAAAELEGALVAGGVLAPALVVVGGVAALGVAGYLTYKLVEHWTRADGTTATRQSWFRYTNTEFGTLHEGGTVGNFRLEHGGGIFALKWENSNPLASQSYGPEAAAGRVNTCTACGYGSLLTQSNTEYALVATQASFASNLGQIVFWNPGTPTYGSPWSKNCAYDLPSVGDYTDGNLLNALVTSLGHSLGECSGWYATDAQMQAFVRHHAISDPGTAPTAVRDFATAPNVAALNDALDVAGTTAQKTFDCKLDQEWCAENGGDPSATGVEYELPDCGHQTVMTCEGMIEDAALAAGAQLPEFTVRTLTIYNPLYDPETVIRTSPQPGTVTEPGRIWIYENPVAPYTTPGVQWFYDGQGETGAAPGRVSVVVQTDPRNYYGLRCHWLQDFGAGVEEWNSWSSSFIGSGEAMVLTMKPLYVTRAPGSPLPDPTPFNADPLTFTCEVQITDAVTYGQVSPWPERTFTPGEGEGQDPGDVDGLPPGDGGGGTGTAPCVCPALDFGPLQVGATGKFPFGVFAYVDDFLRQSASVAAAPSFTLSKPGGGSMVVNFANADPDRAIRDVSDLVIKLVASLASVWWLASICLGLGKGERVGDE